MAGIDRVTGKPIGNYEHACQSVVVIFTTMIGARVMRREFGAGVLELLGRLMRPQLFAAFQALVVVAIDTWEPRFRVRRVTFAGSVDAVRRGEAQLDIEVDWRPRGHLGDFRVEGRRTLAAIFNGTRWAVS